MSIGWKRRDSPLSPQTVVNCWRGGGDVLQPSRFVIHRPTCSMPMPESLQATGSKFSCQNSDIRSNSSIVGPQGSNSPLSASGWSWAPRTLQSLPCNYTAEIAWPRGTRYVPRRSNSARHCLPTKTTGPTNKPESLHSLEARLSKCSRRVTYPQCCAK